MSTSSVAISEIPGNCLLSFRPQGEILRAIKFSMYPNQKDFSPCSK